ncbi:unnamed protein product [Linum tenue]|uniref:Uncharacterized protein n=1 Tax=Linum tenue TaxID=586396 RepID=A0AAV0GN46_9ROSI|nr:unnamed protein product [Linum tenue]
MLNPHLPPKQSLPIMR